MPNSAVFFFPGEDAYTSLWSVHGGGRASRRYCTKRGAADSLPAGLGAMFSRI